MASFTPGHSQILKADAFKLNETAKQIRAVGVTMGKAIDGVVAPHDEPALMNQVEASIRVLFSDSTLVDNMFQATAAGLDNASAAYDGVDSNIATGGGRRAQ